MREIIARRVILFRIYSKLQAEERIKAREMIKEHFMDIDKKNVFQNNIIKRIFYTYNYTLFEITSFFRFIVGTTLKRCKSLWLRSN